MPLAFKTKSQDFQKYYLTRAKDLYKKPVIKASLTLIFSLLTISLLVFFALRPTFATITNLLKEIEDKKKADRQLGEKINTLTTIQGKYNQIKKDLLFINEALPENGEYGKLIQKIEYLAYLNNLNILSSEFPAYTLVGKYEEEEEKEETGKETKKEETTEKKITEAEHLEFTLNVQGKFSDTKQFLKTLENFDRLVILDSFSLSKKEKEEALINTQVICKAFFFNKENEVKR